MGTIASRLHKFMINTMVIFQKRLIFILRLFLLNAFQSRSTRCTFIKISFLERQKKQANSSISQFLLKLKTSYILY